MSTTPINPAPTNSTSTTSTPGNPTWNTLSLDESLALRTAATRLATDFEGVFGAATIERFLHSSFDQFALRATVVKFLPLMAERASTFPASFPNRGPMRPSGPRMW